MIMLPAEAARQRLPVHSVFLSKPRMRDFLPAAKRYAKYLRIEQNNTHLAQSYCK